MGDDKVTKGYERLRDVKRFLLSLTYHFGITLALGLWPLAFISCDIIEPPYLEDHEPSDSTAINPTNVVVFDFTGHTCKWCPDAHRAISQLNSLYGHRVIPVAFHLGYFAIPWTGDRFTTDFRTPEGEQFESWFPFVSFPTGTVQTMDSKKLQYHSSWASEVASRMKEDAPVSIDLEVTFQEEGRLFSVNTSVNNTQTLEKKCKIAVYLLEDGIIDWQKDALRNPEDVPNYVHNHLFRTSFNSVWGETINADDVWEKGTNFDKTYTLTLSPEWVASNCSVVAFIFDDQNKSILQAAIRKLEE